MEENLRQQQAELDAGQTERFHSLDYDFHKLICTLSKRPGAFGVIENCKSHVDRLCVLSLTHEQAAADVMEDHRAIAKALAARNVPDARAMTKTHLSRLDQIITEIYESHTDYFQR